MQQNLSKLNAIFLESNILLTHYFFSPQGDIQKNLGADFLKKFDGIVVAGGDGSIQMLVNHLYVQKVQLPLGILPFGTSNDFARNLQIPINMEKAAMIITEGYLSYMDVGLLNESCCFVDAFAGGNLIDAAFTTDGALKKALGVGAYYLNLFQGMIELKFHDLKITVENKTMEKRALLFMLSNGKHVGGMKNLFPKAKLSDGKFEMLVVNECSKFELIQSVMEALKGGAYGVKYFEIFTGSQFRVESQEKMQTTVDGEIGPKLPINMQVLKQHLPVFTHKKNHKEV